MFGETKEHHFAHIKSAYQAAGIKYDPTTAVNIPAS